MKTQAITLEKDPEAAKEYDFRVIFLGCPIFDMKLAHEGYEKLGDGDQLSEGLKDIAFVLFNSRVYRYDHGKEFTYEDFDTRFLVELVRQKFRHGVEKGLVHSGETARTYFRRNLEVRFLQ